MSDYRYLGDINDSTIKYANELIVWCHKENTFIKADSSNFPKNNCMICPTLVKAQDGSQYSCPKKINDWNDFKNHISVAEKTFGELIAFPVDFENLPDKRNYKKFRNYGHVHGYFKKDSVLIFDIKQNRFIRLERSKLAKIYSKKNRCTYCPCIRRINKSVDIIKHLQVLEKKFYCFLIVDNLSQNDETNQRRIQDFVAFTKYDLAERRSKRIKNQEEKKVVEENLEDPAVHNENNAEDEHENNDKDRRDKNLVILEELKEFHKKNFLAIESYIDNLKSNLDSAADLNKSIIDGQDKMVLKKRVEDMDEKTKNFIYKLPLNLCYNDLDILMKKSGVTEDFEIVKAEMNLDLYLESISNKTPKLEPKSFTKDAVCSSSKLSNVYEGYNDLNNNNLSPIKIEINQQVNVSEDSNDLNNNNLSSIKNSKIRNQKSNFESKSFIKDSPRFTVNLPNDYYKTDDDQQGNVSVDKNDLGEKEISEYETESLTNDESIINEELVHDEFFEQLKTEDESMEEELLVNNDDLSTKQKLISNNDKNSPIAEKSTGEKLITKDVQLNNHVVYIDEDSNEEVINLTSWSHKLGRITNEITNEIKTNKTKIERKLDLEDDFSNSTHSSNFKKTRFI